MNEFTTIFEWMESSFLNDAQALLGKADATLENKALIPIWIESLMYKSLGVNHFGLRLPNVLLLILTFVGFYFYGKKLFGKRSTLITLLVMGSSFLPVNFAKIASGDIWLFAMQLMNFIFLILYLKQPINKWKYGFWIFTVLGALVHPLSMFVWSLGLWVYLQLMHPRKSNLKGLVLLPLLLVIYVPLYFFGFVSFETNHFFMAIGSGNFKWYFVIILLGILPWFGFLPASLWDMIQKFRKKEEMAIINVGWILLAIFSQSLILIAAFSFIIAKNLESFFKRNYPYRRWVKGFCLVNMMITFIVLFSVLTGGFIQFQGTGYKSLLGLSAIYWMMSMVSVLGLWMMRNSWVTGGMAASGLMATWLFWLQVNPLVESQRNLPKQVYQQMKKMGVSRNLSNQPRELYHLTSDSIFYQQNFEVYLNELKVKTVAIDSISIMSIPSKNQKALVAIPERIFEKLPQGHVFFLSEKHEIVGGTGFLKRDEKYAVLEF